MARVDILREELNTDPLTRGYAGMTDQQVVDSLAVVDRPNSALWPSTKVLNVIDKTEFMALTNGNKQLVWDILHIGEINPYGREADLFTDIFGGGSMTMTTLAGMRTSEQISRAQEIGIAPVYLSLVQEARSD